MQAPCSTSSNYRIKLTVRPVTSLAKGASAAPARSLCGALDRIDMTAVSIPQAGRCERCGEPAALVLDEDIYFMLCGADGRHCQLLWPSASAEPPRSDGLDPEWLAIGSYHAEALARATGGNAEVEQWRAKMVEEARELDVALDIGELQRIWSSSVVRFVVRFVNRELGGRSV